MSECFFLQRIQSMQSSEQIVLFILSSCCLLFPAQLQNAGTGLPSTFSWIDKYRNNARAVRENPFLNDTFDPLKPNIDGTCILMLSCMLSSCSVFLLGCGGWHYLLHCDILMFGISVRRLLNLNPYTTMTSFNCSKLH